MALRWVFCGIVAGRHKHTISECRSPAATAALSHRQSPKRRARGPALGPGGIPWCEMSIIPGMDEQVGGLWLDFWRVAGRFQF